MAGLAQIRANRAAGLWYSSVQQRNLFAQHEKTRPEVAEFQQQLYLAMFVIDPSDLPFGDTPALLSMIDRDAQMY
jgi:hypothetical protein